MLAVVWKIAACYDLSLICPSQALHVSNTCPPVGCTTGEILGRLWKLWEVGRPNFWKGLTAEGSLKVVPGP